MCGIAGFVGRGGRSDLERMIATLHHRGPDDGGLYVEGGVGLGHARLSIIDLSPTGHQPMWDDAGGIGVIFNGEIYNFAELKASLVKDGYRFRGTSDTEVIIALYKKYGVACFEKLGGMFAIALYDKTTKMLILARDRMGKKPLYWGVFEGTFVFGSEAKALLAHPLVKKEIDLQALNSYFALDYVPTPRSIWRGMEKLEPGSFLTYSMGKVLHKRFWEPDQREALMPEEEALRQLDGHIAKAVSERLVSDVPLGIFLSGGLDSSTVAYYAAEAKRAEGEKIHTFSIGFTEKSFDESPYAHAVAKHLDTIHHHKIFRGEDSLAVIPEIYSSLDEPMADASIVPTYLLSRFTKEHVTVALGGDGGDELFAGYPTFQAERAMPLFRSLPTPLKRAIIIPLIRKLPSTFGNFGIEFILKQFFEGASEAHIVRRHMRWLGPWNDAERERLFTTDAWRSVGKENVYQEAERYFAQSNAIDERNRLLFAYQRTYMMDEVLVKVDRASMRASLEVRAPLLDHRLVEFVNRLPYAYKLRGLSTKYLLKKLMENKLPAEIIHRKKKGFGMPVGGWLRGPLRGWAEDLLSGKNGDASGIINLEYARRLFAEHLGGKTNHRKKLWNILVFLEWKKNFLS